MKVGFAYGAGGALPLTRWYQAFCEAVRRHSDFVDPHTPDALAIPEEDTALEHLWPRYYTPGEEFIRGTYNRDVHTQYLLALALTDSPLCILNMHTLARMHEYMSKNPYIIIADITLNEAERALNPRSISMPALPITVGQGGGLFRHKVCTFRGMNSHPVRVAMMGLNDYPGFFCELVEPGNHYGRLDAERDKSDAAYVSLMADSEFAMVPRGDAHYSYRLLEALSFGCLPVIISDGWVLPFDRLIAWDAIALHVPEAEVMSIPARVAALSFQQRATMRAAGAAAYAQYLNGFDGLVKGLLEEVEIIYKSEQNNPAMAKN